VHTLTVFGVSRANIFAPLAADEYEKPARDMDEMQNEFKDAAGAEEVLDH
jgi:hypothetical protein